MIPRRLVAAIACVALLGGCSAGRQHPRLVTAAVVTAIVTIVVAVPITTGCTPGPDCNATTHLQTFGVAAVIGAVFGGLIALEMSRGRKPAPFAGRAEIANQASAPAQVGACLAAGVANQADVEKKCDAALVAYRTDPLCACESGADGWTCAVTSTVQCERADGAPQLAVAWGIGREITAEVANKKLVHRCEAEGATLRSADVPTCRCDTGSFDAELCQCQASGVCR